MTLLEHGLGAIPSPPDDRDHTVALDTAIQLPRRFVLGETTKTGPAPAQNQHLLPWCGGFTITDGLRYRGKVQGEGILNLDSGWAYAHSRARLGFTPIPAEGTTARAILDTAHNEGIPEIGKPETRTQHMVGSYGRLPFTAAAAMTALVQYRNLVIVGMAWPFGFFHPVNGIAPKPGQIAGGHLGSFCGYDMDVAGGSVLWLNHAGPLYGIKGKVWIPWRYVLDLWHDHWKVLGAGVSVRPAV